MRKGIGGSTKADTQNTTNANTNASVVISITGLLFFISLFLFTSLLLGYLCHSIPPRRPQKFRLFLSFTSSTVVVHTAVSKPLVVTSKISFDFDNNHNLNG